MNTYRVDIVTEEGPTSLYVLAPEADAEVNPDLLEAVLTQAVHLPEGAQVVGFCRVGVGVVMVEAAEDSAAPGVPEELQRILGDQMAAVAKYCGPEMHAGWKSEFQELAARMHPWA
jgi:hypothetical protein